MTTTVTITGSGCPIPTADRAGPGVLVTCGDVHLQFDAGRASVMRLMGAGSSPGQLTALFLTHHHSDHTTGLQDVALTRWLMDRGDRLEPLPIVAPEGPSADFAERMLEVWADDLAVRRLHTGRTATPGIDVVAFPVPDGPVEVWRRGDVVVKAGQVRHEPVEGAVGYRVETPDGVVAISGDTVVCDEMAALAEGADVVVYEALRFSLIPPGSPNHFILDYHADTIAIGKQVASLNTPTVILTHLIPPPQNEEQEQGFSDDVRAGGYDGDLIVARDLTTVTLG
ncbi:MAG: MBL fold metallo-hydrolase [Acidimicrobiales bacterium]